MTDEKPAPAKRTRKRTVRAGGTPSVATAQEVEPVVEPAAEPVVEPPVEPPVEPVDTLAPQAVATQVAEVAETPAPVAAVSSLRVEQGGIAEATAGSVEVHLGGIGRLEADEVHVRWGGVGAARADRLNVEFGSVGAAAAGDLRITQGFASNVLARNVVVEQGIVRTMIAQRVTFTRPSAVLVMLAGSVSGEVRPLLDWRGALAAGAAFGLISALVKVVRRRT